MFEELHRMAHEAAHEAFRAVLKDFLLTGTWNPELEARYHAAERLVDLTEEALQVADPEAPDYFALLTADPGDHFAYPDSAA